MVAGPPGGLSTVSIPSTEAARCASPRSPVPPRAGRSVDVSRDRRAATPVVSDDNTEKITGPRDGHLRLRGVRVRSLSTAGCRPRMNSRSSERASTGFVVSLGDRPPGGFADVGEAGPRDAKVHRERDQPLLGAIMQVAFDPAAFGIGGGDDAGPAAGQRLDSLRQVVATARAEELLPGAHRPLRLPIVGSCDPIS